jgi:hypothetical protein
MAVNKAIVDKLLTNVSQAYIPQGFVSELALTPLKTVQSSGRIGKYGNQHLRLESTLMGGKGVAKRVEIRQYASDSYFIKPNGLEDMITPEEYDNVEQPFDIEKDVTAQLTSLLYIGKEKALADSLRSTSILTQNVTLSGTSQWNDYTNSDPIAVINTAKSVIRSASGVLPDTMIMDEGVMNVLRFHPKLLRNLGFADNRAGSLEDADIARAFRVKRILVADVVFDTAKEGQTSSLAPLWGKDVILASLPTDPAKLQKTLGYYVTKGSEGPRKVYKQNVVNPPDSKSIIVKDSYDMVLTDTACGYVIKAAIA